MGEVLAIRQKQGQAEERDEREEWAVEYGTGTYGAKVHNFTLLCGRCKMEGGEGGVVLPVDEQESGKARGWANIEL